MSHDESEQHTSQETKLSIKYRIWEKRTLNTLYVDYVFAYVSIYVYRYLYSNGAGLDYII